MEKSGPTQKPKVSTATTPAAQAKPTAAATKAANLAARKKVDPGKDLATPKEEYPAEVKKIEGKWGEYARAAVDIAKENGMSLNDPMVRFAMVLCAFMGKYARYIDLVPGNFRKSLDKDKLGKEELSKLQKEKLRAQMSKEVPKDFREFSDLYKAENDKRAKDKKPALNATETSTLYVSYLLFGSPPKSDSTEPKVDYLTNHKVLAARLSHEYTDLKREHRAYGDSGLRALKKRKTIPKGTVLFFAPNFKTGIIAAYATGDRQKFVYYVPGSKDKKSFQLNSSTSPVKNELSLLAAFVPTHLQSTPAPAPKPKQTPAKTPTVNPESLAKTLDTTVDNTIKQVNEEMEQKYLELKDKKAAGVLSLLNVADVLSTSIEKVEDAVKKAKLLKPEQYAKIKEKHEKALKRYHDFLEVILFKIFSKEFLSVIDQFEKLPAKMKNKISRDKLKKLSQEGYIFINPYLDKIREYWKRSKDLLPKSASK